MTPWGLADNHTWLNSFPVNRTTRPLLFDTALHPKWAFWAFVDPAIIAHRSLAAGYNAPTSTKAGGW